MAKELNLTMPKHVAVIMDGNNRWAKKRLLPSAAGHKAGVKAVRKAVEYAMENGIEVLTLFAFSSENWERPKSEVEALMELFLTALEKQVEKLNERNIRLLIMGDLGQFSDRLQDHIHSAMDTTKDNTGLTLVVAANYGGKWDIAHAAKNLAEDIKTGRLDPSEVDEDVFGRYTQLSDLPQVDLCMRTSGEQRISNFMLWQMAYAEFYFDNVLWPDFDETVFEKAVIAFNERDRRFGKR